MKRKFNPGTVLAVIYWLIFIALAGLFFTNDFGLVDIHKTSIITAIGIDMEEREVQVTAEVAVPQPSQSGENIKYTQVQGSGLTIADALNEINAKTGFYPKLQFCKLILVGESCMGTELFQVLGCFYRKNYSELTALVAMCEGKASDMLANKSGVSQMTSEAIRKVLSDESEKSANSSSASLKKIATSEYSYSHSCYMPYVQVSKPGTSQNGGNGDNVGGESPDGSGGGNDENGGGGGSSGGGAGESGQSGSSGGDTGGAGQSGEVEFTARKTAYFSRGDFKGILDEQQSFALDVLKSELRVAVLPCDADDIHYTLGLKGVKSKIKLSVEKGVPQVKISVSAKAQIQGARVKVEPKKVIRDDVIPPYVLDSAKQVLVSRISSLLAACRESDCDLLGLKDQLYKFHRKNYDELNAELLTRAEVTYDVKIESVT